MTPSYNNAERPLAMSRRSVLALGLALGSATGCRGGRSQPFRLSGIPDADKEQLTRRYEVVERFLSEVLLRPVEYVHVPDYTAAVTALASHKIDAAWLGGVTSVLAQERTPAGVRFLAARQSDLQFKSYFVANRAWVDRGEVSARSDRQSQPLAELAALAPVLKRGRFSFGDKSSTSGHIMPRWFLGSEAVGLSPQTAFAAPVVYQLKGGHSATLSAVASGAVDFGAVNYVAWESASPTIQANAPVIYVTPPYVDYCFVAHGALESGLLDALRAALVGLDRQNASDRAVLDVFSAESFVAVEASQWDQIRSVVQTLEQQGGLS